MSDQRSAEVIQSTGLPIYYRDDHGFRWEPLPGENPRAGGKVQVRNTSWEGSCLMGIFLDGTITVDSPR